MGTCVLPRRLPELVVSGSAAMPGDGGERMRRIPMSACRNGTAEWLSTMIRPCAGDGAALARVAGLALLLFFAVGLGLPSERIQSSLGSGVIVGPVGVVVTNTHVIKGRGETEIRIALADKREVDAKV